MSLSGRFPSYFAGKEVPLGSEEGAPTAVALEESPETRLLVVGDTEFLSDFVARALGDTEAGFFTQNLRFLENAIDWMTLDSDMIAIRSRGASARRLAQTDRGAQVTIEALNYVVPALLLLAFAVHRFWRRRRVEPLVTAAAPSPSRSEG